MRKTKEDAEITRKKLLDAALIVFTKKGYVLTTLEDIAKEAGVTRGAIYWHFKGGKPEIFRELAIERSKKSDMIINRILEEGGSALQILERILVKSMELMEEDEDFRAVQELAILRTEVVPELKEMLEEKFDVRRDAIWPFVEIVQKGQRSGEIRADIDPEVITIALYGLLIGVITMWVSNPSMFSLKAYASPIVQTFISGIATEQGLKDNH